MLQLILLLVVSGLFAYLRIVNQTRERNPSLAMGVGYLLLAYAVVLALQAQTWHSFSSGSGVLCAAVGGILVISSITIQHGHYQGVVRPYTLIWLKKNAPRVFRGCRLTFNPFSSRAVYDASSHAIDLSTWMTVDFNLRAFVNATAWIELSEERLAEWQGAAPMQPEEVRYLVRKCIHENMARWTKPDQEGWEWYERTNTHGLQRLIQEVIMNSGYTVVSLSCTVALVSTSAYPETGEADRGDLGGLQMM